MGISKNSIPKTSVLVFTSVHSTVLHRGKSLLFTLPKAIEKLDFEIEHSARKLAVQQIGVFREE